MLSLLLLFAGSTPAAESDLNVVLIMADDCTKADLGCYGGQAATPNLDLLQTEGMTFTRCYQAAPMCSPTRHCLYTGIYPVKSGAYPNHTFVRPSVGSIALDLRAHGYRVALSGKKHISPERVFPFEYSATGNNPDPAAIDHLLADCDTHDTPFLLIATSNEPHSPWNKGDASAYDPNELELPPTWIDTPKTRAGYAAYLAEITYFDRQVGDILAALERHHHAEDTLVIVLSEQGSSFPFAKWTCYHAGLGSGMIVRWPGRVQPGSRSEALVEYVDVVPTILEAVGFSGDRKLDGRSFAAVLTGEAEAHKQSVFGIQTSRGINDGPPHYGIRSVQTGSLRLIHNLSPETPFECAINPTDWFGQWEAAAETDAQAAAILHRYTHRPEWELYDIDADPHEQTSLYDDPAYADRIAAMKQTLAAWMAEQGDEGQPTELRALERMKRAKKAKKTRSRATTR